MFEKAPSTTLDAAPEVVAAAWATKHIGLVAMMPSQLMMRSPAGTSR